MEGERNPIAIQRIQTVLGLFAAAYHSRPLNCPLFFGIEFLNLEIHYLNSLCQISPPEAPP